MNREKFPSGLGLMAGLSLKALSEQPLQRGAKPNSASKNFVNVLEIL
jgi:hypothetical protein